jgi:DNA-binding NarL/FixJ family response regulator
MSVAASTLPTSAGAAPWRIALADDHAIVRMGYRRLLELEADLSVVAEYADAESAAADLCQTRRGAVDLLILDLSMPGRSGLDLLRQLQREQPALKVLMVSMHDSAALVGQCLGAGACGFVAKSSDPQALVDAVRQALRGETVGAPRPAAAPRAGRRPLPHEQLTGRELEVLQQLLAGLGVEATAARMGLSEKTVSNYQTQIRQKLGVVNSIELVHYARRHGLMP